MNDRRRHTSAVVASAAATPPEAWFAVGAVSQYLGAAIAVGLFDEIDAPGVAWLRVLGAAIVVVAIRRPWRRAWSATDLAWVAAFGTALAGMNLFFYLAIQELPLGNAVAIEFLGPVAVAGFRSRTKRSIAALVLAVAGVALLAEVQPDGSSSGVLFALAAGAAWAGYIVLGHRVARSGASMDGLGLALAFGLVVITPVGVSDVGPALGSPDLILLGLATGVLSNAIPYGIDQAVLRRLDQYRFALLQAMLPVSATLIGAIALGQSPTAGELIGIGIVALALLIGTVSRNPAPATP
jgi:inner membrane transporter RhtA